MKLNGKQVISLKKYQNTYQIKKTVERLSRNLENFDE
jgi:hypothetical protein